MAAARRAVPASAGARRRSVHALAGCGQPTSKTMPCASGSSLEPLIVAVWRRMYAFQASEPDSRPPPVSFSPPNAPPISAPLGPMLTFAMPQSRAEPRQEALGLAQVVREDARRRGPAARRCGARAPRRDRGSVRDVEDRRERLGRAPRRSGPACARARGARSTHRDARRRSTRSPPLTPRRRRRALARARACMALERRRAEMSGPQERAGLARIADRHGRVGLARGGRTARRRCSRARSGGAASCSAGRPCRPRRTRSRAPPGRGRRSARRSSRCCRRARAGSGRAALRRAARAPCP